jgi:multiple sugar transport system substrate-binding protein
MSLSSGHQPLSRRTILASVACALGASSLLAACGGGTVAAPTAAQPAAVAPTAAPAATPAAPQPTTAAVQPTAAAETGKKVALTYWHIFGGTDTPTMNAIVDNFNKAHPDVAVTPTQFPFGQFEEKITTALAGNTAPDVFMSGPAPVATVMGIQKLVKQLDDFASKDGVKPDLWLEPFRPSFYGGGHFWGLRFNTDIRVLYYSVAAFTEAGLDPAKPPANWAELEQYTQKLTKKDSSGKVTRMGFYPTFGNTFFLNYDRSNGGTIVNDAGTEISFNNQTGVDTLAWMVKMSDLVGGSTAYTSFSAGFGTDAADPFLLGKVAMTVNGSWVKTTYEKYGPNIQYKTALIPKAKQDMSISGGFTLSAPSSTPADHMEAAWQFIKYCCTDQEQQLFMAKTGQLSALVALQDAPFFKTDPVFQTFSAQLQHTSLFPWQPPVTKLFKATTDATQKALYHQAEPKAALDEAYQQVKQQIDEYNQAHPEWAKSVT